MLDVQAIVSAAGTMPGHFTIVCEPGEAAADCRPDSPQGCMHMHGYLICETGDIRSVEIVVYGPVLAEMHRAAALGLSDSIVDGTIFRPARALREGNFWQVEGGLADDGATLVVERLLALDRVAIRGNRPCLLATIEREPAP